MNKFISSTLLTLTSLNCIGQCNNPYWFDFTNNCVGHANTHVFLTQDGECNFDPWVTIFEDHFDDNSLDQSKWVLPYQGVIRDYDFSHEKQWYITNNIIDPPNLPITNNIEVSNGTLKLISKKQTITGKYYDHNLPGGPLVSKTFEFTSAQISSKYKFKHGKFEIRCKIPGGMGYWPAFWLYGEVGSINDEIDVFEFWKNSTTGHNMNVHYNCEACSYEYNASQGYDQEMHTFTVIWDDYKIEWSVDGVPRRTDYRFSTMLNQQVGCNGVNAFMQYIRNDLFPIHPMEVIANVAMEQGTYAPDASTPLINQMEIEYISVSKQLDCNGTVTIADNSELNMGADEFNVILGTTVLLGGNVFLLPGQQLTIIASEQITLLPGFVALPGSQLNLIINPNICIQLRTSSLATIINDSKENTTTLSPKSIDDVKRVLNDYQANQVSLTTLNFNIDVAENLNMPIPSIAIYPNPTSESLSVDFSKKSLSEYTIILFNEQGQIMDAFESHNQAEAVIDLKSRNNGIYILKVIDRKSNNVEVFKFLKQ